MRNKSGRKIITGFVVLALSVLSLGGCTGRAYGSGDRQKLETVAKEQLEAYFAEQLPDTQVVSVHGVEANREVTLMVLTNYVHGEYKENGVSYEYYFDTDAQRLFTNKHYENFSRQVKDKIIGELGLTDKAQILYSDINLYLPHVTEAGAFNKDVGEEEGQLPPAEKVMAIAVPFIPIEAAEDTEAYLYGGDREEVISVSLTLAVDVSENLDLQDYTFQDFYYDPREDGIFYRYLCIHNTWSVTYDRIGYGAEPTITAKESLTAIGDYERPKMYDIRYDLWGDTETEGAVQHVIVSQKWKRLDTETGEITED